MSEYDLSPLLDRLEALLDEKYAAFNANLVPGAATVAMAAPAAPRWKTATSRRSPAILQMQAMKTVISGVLESPMPLKMLPIRL